MPFNPFAFAATVREPVVSGAFYPSDPSELKTMVDGFLAHAEKKPVIGDIQILLVPHAGYIYSGQVAAYGYKQLEGKSYDRVIVIAFSHSVAFPGASVFSGDAYRTPLGLSTIDKDAVTALKEKEAAFTYYAPAEAREHSLEVQLPFLQTVLPNIPVIPIVMTDFSKATAEQLADALVAVNQGKKVLYVISTDLSHYETYDTGNALDATTLRTIQTLSSKETAAGIQRGSVDACGIGPILVASFLAEKLGLHHSELLKHANSGDASGDKSRVVGYAALVITDGPPNQTKSAATNETKKPESPTLPDAERKTLLGVARRTLENHFDKEKKIEMPADQPLLQEKHGVFVTLHKNKQLRGCIGCFFSDKPLSQTVSDFAINAAFHDPRFPQLTQEEIKELDIEISILSPMRKIQNVQEIELGKHGIIIRKGTKSGTFLPQVATETGWTLDEFLGHCAQDKAGIGWNGWKDAEIYIYTTEVFSEKEWEK